MEKKKRLENHWGMLKWLVAFIDENDEKWKDMKKKRAKESQEQEQKENWEQMTREEKMKQIREEEQKKKKLKPVKNQEERLQEAVRLKNSWKLWREEQGEEDGEMEEMEEYLGGVSELCMTCAMLPCTCMLTMVNRRIEMLKTAQKIQNLKAELAEVRPPASSHYCSSSTADRSSKRKFDPELEHETEGVGSQATKTRKIVQASRFKNLKTSELKTGPELRCAGEVGSPVKNVKAQSIQKLPKEATEKSNDKTKIEGVAANATRASSTAGYVGRSAQKLRPPSSRSQDLPPTDPPSLRPGGVTTPPPRSRPSSLYGYLCRKLKPRISPGKEVPQVLQVLHRPPPLGLQAVNTPAAPPPPPQINTTEASGTPPPPPPPTNMAIRIPSQARVEPTSQGTRTVPPPPPPPPQSCKSPHPQSFIHCPKIPNPASISPGRASVNTNPGTPPPPPPRPPPQRSIAPGSSPSPQSNIHYPQVSNSERITPRIASDNTSPGWHSPTSST